MIYYFSGTGNSRYAAEKISRLTGDKCVNIADIYKGKVSDVAGRNDVTGFVFPVYFSGLPEMVKRFASNPEIKNKLAPYVFCVITCGADGAAAGERLGKILERKPDLCISLRMPDNYVIAYDPSTPEKAKQILKKADARINGISDRILRREPYYNITSRQKIATAVMYPFYGLFRTTLFFGVDKTKCISCGLCSKLCPDDGIKMKDGHPVWTDMRCQHCTACINACPVEAIRFTKLTDKRGRYYITKLGKNEKKQETKNTPDSGEE